MKTISVVLGSALFAVVLAAPLRAQTASENATLKVSLSAADYARVNAIVQDASAKGLPSQALVAKAIEGTAKHVPGDRIVVALQEMNARMVRASAVLSTSRYGGDPSRRSVDIVAVSDALQRKVPESALRSLVADSAGRASISVTAYALSDLVAQAVPVAVAVDVIGAWRATGTTGVQIKDVSATVERLIRQGVTPARAGTGVTAALRNHVALGGLTSLTIGR